MATHLRAAATTEGSQPARKAGAEDTGEEGATAEELVWVACARIMLVAGEYCMLSTATVAGVSEMLHAAEQREEHTVTTATVSAGEGP